MALTDAQATLASGGLSLTGGLVEGVLSYLSNKAINKENLKMAMLLRSDTLAATRAEREHAKKQLALQTRAQAFNEQETTETKGYNRMQSAYQRGADLLTQQMNLNQIKAAPFIKRG